MGCLRVATLVVIVGYICVTVAFPTSDTSHKGKGCGYESCPAIKDGMLNVHLIPHSHQDVGWLKTVDQYYYGSRNNIQKAGVQYVYDTVVQELLKDPSRRFVQVETAFIMQWYAEQTPELQDKVKMLINEGRLEVIGGGWSMNDEAAAHYHSLIDQFTWGLRMLNDTFGECSRPKIGWQIDPFGHTREQASIFAQMGFSGMFFARLDYQDKNARMQSKTPEMIWYASEDLDDNEMFTSVLYNHYSAPPGFCFDMLCSDDPLIDNERSTDYNVKTKVDTIVEWLERMSNSYRTNNLLVTMGDDFNYMDATMNYKNMDKLIKYTNARQSEGSKINILYSTPSCYLKAIHDANITWPTKSDDFIPYETDYHSFWSGYYTSRPTQKRYEREGNHFLQILKQLSVIAPIQQDYFETHLTVLRTTMGVMQHHDAITGTEKQHVADDYARMLYEAMEAGGVNARAILNQLYNERHDFLFNWNTCQANVSICAETESMSSVAVAAYNPLGQSSSDFIRLPVQEGKYVVRNDDGQPIASALLPIPESVKNIPFREGSATHELVFHAEQVPPVGYRGYHISKADNDVSSSMDAAQSAEVSIGNEHLQLQFDNNGLLASIAIHGKEYPLKQNFYYYQGAYGNNEEFRNRSSGAYIFRPNGTERHLAHRASIKVFKTPLCEEVHQVFSDWVSQVIRVYHDARHVELEWLVGPIPIDDGTGKEIISRFDSGIKNDGTFWTDSNGREMLRRKRDKRETWDLDLVEPISGNYYPITAKLAIQDRRLRMSLLTDRAQGGSSLTDGSIELMVHRRLLRDDAFGVGEALNETQFGIGLIARGKHWLVFGEHQSTDSPTMVARERFLQNKVLLPVWPFVSRTPAISYDEFRQQYSNIYSAITQQLPPNVKLLTLEPWKDGSLLVRFEHLFSKNEDPVYSRPVSFDVRSVFYALNIVSIRETTLGANQWKEDVQRLKFTPDSAQQLNEVDSPPQEPGKTATSRANEFEIDLKPMEIRTFIMERRR